MEIYWIFMTYCIISVSFSKKCYLFHNSFFCSNNTHVFHVLYIFNPLACAECDDSLPFSGASSTPLCYVLFPATLLHQLFFHPLSPHLAICFLVYLSIVLFPNGSSPYSPKYFSSAKCPNLLWGPCGLWVWTGYGVNWLGCELVRVQTG